MNKLKTTIKKSKVLIFSIAFAIMMIMITAANTNTAEASISTLAELKNQYQSGSKRNSSYKNKAWQCHGFACMIADALTGTDPYNWSKVYNLNSLKVGDIVRFKRPHSIFITSVSGNTITYVDCNWVAANTVQWDQQIDRSRLTSKFGALDYVMSCPQSIALSSQGTSSQSTLSQGIPSIDGVKIDSINSESVTFHFSVSNGTLAKILIESVSTGQKIEEAYTSGLSNITYTFNKNRMNQPGRQFRIYIYAYSGSNGNYKNEQLHKVTYGEELYHLIFPPTATDFSLTGKITSDV